MGQTAVLAKDGQAELTELSGHSGPQEDPPSLAAEHSDAEALATS